MTITFIVVTVFLGCVQILVASMRPPRSTLSRFELTRRVEAGDAHARSLQHREQMMPGVLALRHAVIGVLLVCVSVTAIIALWWWGVAVALIFAIFSGSLARLGFVHHTAQKLYIAIEPQLFAFIKKAPWFFTLIHAPRQAPVRAERLESREQLLHLLEQSGTLLSDDEKLLLRHGLQFHELLAETVMTPIHLITSVDANELLGPLTLDELHKSGHRYFPVTSKTKEGIVGILELDDLLTADARHTSPTAEKAMDPHVFYIRETDNLRHALSVFLHHHQHMLIVVGGSGEPIGLLTMGDVIKSLFGTKLTH